MQPKASALWHPHLESYEEFFFPHFKNDIIDLKMANTNETAFLSATIKEIRILQPQKNMPITSGTEMKNSTRFFNVFHNKNYDQRNCLVVSFRTKGGTSFYSSH